MLEAPVGAAYSNLIIFCSLPPAAFDIVHNPQPASAVWGQIHLRIRAQAASQRHPDPAEHAAWRNSYTGRRAFCPNTVDAAVDKL